MELLTALENMAAVAEIEEEHDNDIDPGTVRKWQNLFGYSYHDAQEQIERQREDWNTLVPTSLWEIVKKEQEALGFDRRAYSRWLQKLTQPIHNLGNDLECKDAEREYLVRLEGPIDSSKKIAEVAGLASPPPMHCGESLEGEDTARFCCIDVRAKCALQSWIAKDAPWFRPLFISHSRARKDLSAVSKAPYLGCDTTLPQHRFTHRHEIPRPAQDEYPVWYFFYGTLATVATLERLFELLNTPTDSIELHAGYILGGRLETWGGGKYKALIDADQTATVYGSALLVASKEHEDALCYYETQAYEVVRCKIGLDADCDQTRVVAGCTFRFVGEVD